MVQFDYHVHSSYSDGSDLERMVAAAAEAGLDGVGFADHCNLTDDRVREERGYTLDDTYPERRADVETAADRWDVAVFDAVEIDYDPDGEDAIAAFLDDADFDYALGSVHYLDGTHVGDREFFRRHDEVPALVDDYYDRLVQLVESELFDVVAHLDVIERNPALRGHATADHYERLAAALSRSHAIPEINAGRIGRAYDRLHPNPSLFDALRERGVEFTVGSDAHSPGDIGPRKRVLDEFVTEQSLEPVRVHRADD